MIKEKVILVFYYLMYKAKQNVSLYQQKESNSVLFRFFCLYFNTSINCSTTYKIEPKGQIIPHYPTIFL